MSLGRKACNQYDIPLERTNFKFSYVRKYFGQKSTKKLFEGIIIGICNINFILELFGWN